MVIFYSKWSLIDYKTYLYEYYKLHIKRISYYYLVNSDNCYTALYCCSFI